MSTPHSDSECTFCQIIRGSRPAELVYETPTAVAFLDRFPVARGHTLVVPRQHAPTLPQLERDVAGALFGSVAEIVKLLDAALHPAGYNIGWNHGAAAGQHVFHLHVHVMPRFHHGGAGVQAVGEGPPSAELTEVGGAIRREARAMGLLRPR